MQCAPLSDAPLVPGLPITSVTTTASTTAAGTALAAAAAEGGGSGGYLEHLFRYTALQLYGVALDATVRLRYKQGRNADFQEVELEVNGQVVLRGALAYGFRNMQVVGSTTFLLLCCVFNRLVRQ